MVKASVIFTDNFVLTIDGIKEQFVFDITKYKRIHDRIIEEGLLAAHEFLVPQKVERETLLLIHTQNYLDSLRNPQVVAEILEFEPVKYLPPDFIWQYLIPIFEWATGGTILACHKALENGMGINLAGGYHHAYPDRGSGFCLLADVAIAIRSLQKQALISKVLIIDCDVHQGDGNAKIFEGDPSVFTFSIHEEDNFPIPKAASDLDIGLPSGTGDEEYLSILYQHIPVLVKDFQPELVIYLAGTDVYWEDNLGGLSLSADGIRRRDNFVVDIAINAGIPLTMVLAGGYSHKSWELHYSSIKDILLHYK
jgi:histone deacetylase 11